MASRGAGVLGIVFILAFIGLGVMYLFFDMQIDSRWWIVFNVMLAGGAVYLLVRDKEVMLLKLMAFLLPFGIGIFYSPMLKADLIWAFDAVLLVLILYWISDGEYWRTHKLYFHQSAVFCIVFIGWALMGIIVAYSPLGTVHALFYLIKAFVFYFYIVNRVTSKRMLKALINWLMVGLTIQGGLGLMQRILGRSLGLVFLGEHQTSLWYELARVRGTLGFPNQFGAYLILLIPLGASLFIFTKNWLLRLFYGTAVGLGLMSLFFTLSRSSWLGIVCAIVVMMIVLITRQRLQGNVVGWMVVVAVGVLIIAYSFWDLIQLRFATGGSGEYRMLMINIAMPIILTHPILGVGLANYAYYSYSQFQFWKPVHNEYLRFAAETGIPGLIFFLLFLFYVFREAFRGVRLKDPYLRAVALGVIGGYVAFLAAVFFGPMLQHYRQIFLFWMLGGLAVSLKRIALTEYRQREIALRRSSRNRSSGEPLKQGMPAAPGGRG
jgi:putative inorganic carbon (HCO3(-)) transporter